MGEDLQRKIYSGNAIRLLQLETKGNRRTGGGLTGARGFATNCLSCDFESTPTLIGRSRRFGSSRRRKSHEPDH